MEQLQMMTLRLLEWAVGLAAGLVVGQAVFWIAPGLMWPPAVGVVCLLIGGKLIFEGMFPGFGYGLAISSMVSLAYFVTYYLGVGLD
ncbi:MAG: hypothetical protein GY925_28820 [Actinomycetia bacterium]|nr:hypothetical protein [Actinomycetes bacterium]